MNVSKRVEKLHPYVPGEQPKDRVYIKLNANENPYPPSKNVAKNVIKFIKNNPEKMGLYPDPDSVKLNEAIAKMLNQSGGVLCNAKVDGKNVFPSDEDKIPFTVTPDMIYSGNGSDEVLSFIFYAFFDSSKKFVMPEFTYSFYPVYAGYYDIPMDLVPLNEDWSLNMEEMVNRAKENKSGIIFANPNAPTAIGIKREQVRKMLESANKDEIFIVDEAYVDFGGESCIPLIKDFDNLIIVRTFSKSLCGAGQRLGYIVANPELIKTVFTVKNCVNHFPIDAISQVSGISACEDVAYYVKTSKLVVQEREKFYDFLIRKGFFVTKSQTNFLFVKHPQISGDVLYKKVKEEGILIRHFATKGIDDFVRITIGTKEQMSKLKNIFEKILAEC
ncbi:MAG: histidinol-phosphate transaminase [Treponema bryantii]|nr:histidinol-phosphate transaminase [Treponema bryantii]